MFRLDLDCRRHRGSSFLLLLLLFALRVSLVPPSVWCHGFGMKMTTTAGGLRRGAIVRTEAGAITSAATSMTMIFSAVA